MDMRWIASWTAAPMSVWAPDAPLSGFFGQTIREVARLSLGGSGAIIRLSNEYGRSTITLDAVELAKGREGAQIEPLSAKPVTFAGSRSVEIYPGTSVYSDPVDIEIEHLDHLAISYHSPGLIPVETYHLSAHQTTFISQPGDFVSAGELSIQQTSTSRYLLSAIYVRAEGQSRAVVCFGDSITDGFGSSLDTNRRWPDALFERLLANGGPGPLAVLNQGIGGNRLLNSRRGARALERFDRDVTSLRGVSHLIVLEGINDIVWPNTAIAGPEEYVTAEQIVGALSQIIARARLSGIKVMMGTITPFEPMIPELQQGAYYTAEKEQMRQTVNRFIRDESQADAVVDFDAVLRDETYPRRLRAEYDCGDHLHPNDAGYLAMAKAIDLEFLA